jgi:3-carboxy-cis,cis-muconate cycloisomerase
MPLFSSAAMQAVVDDRARLQRMLDVEAALARAEADLGVIPAAAAGPIAQACRAERFDPAAIAQGGPAGGNILIPLVKALTAEVAKNDAEAARWVHWGATSQDIIDTALVLELRAGIDTLLPDLDRAIAAFAEQAEKHRQTPTAARTWLQHALPMPFGLKLAGYAAALARARDRLLRVRRDGLVLQFGGAAGTLASLGERGLDVSERLAHLLDLPLPDAPWHSHRDRLADVACALAMLSGTCGKIARDLALLMQTEVGEAFEPAAPGRGASSTMPQKRNPVASAAASSAAALVPQLAATLLAAEIGDHERATGAWQSEWPVFPSLLLLVSGALANVLDIAEGLEVDAARMRANLEITRGAIMAEAVSTALGARLGKQQAHKIVEEAARASAAHKRDLREVLCEDPRVTAEIAPAEIARLFEPLSYQGVSQGFIDRLLAASRRHAGET